ncbi:unnamed protein product [Trypanosoma congolense IL3000]|uniref:WGS project CAEQ00000000 data, annotated contig 1415 n=1 Tax=Trypanosoma congolense (strain IL3000) TaxID=1068625 RepID=F9W623_TRYCI|nr:unnamed protein product [Trypanosoma congolense IL3000]
MKKSQKNSRRRARSKYPQLEKLKKVDGIVADALNCLKGLPTPHAMIQKFESVVQEKFERVTGNFWRMILLLLEQAREDATDDPLKKLKTAHRRRHSLPLISSSSSLLHMRLLREFVKLFKLFVGNNYRSQIQQLKSIMQEKAEAAAVRDSSLITVQTIGGKVRMDPSGREPIKGNDREFVGVGIARPKTEAKSGLEHHIPYVDENATALKSVMEHELTLHLSRFNTEIINCLMQDLSAGIPEMAQACDEQRLQVKSTVLRPFSLVEQNACFDPAKMEALRWKLGKFMNCSVVGMRPVKCLESFVTGLRTTIVEDQILLMLASEGALARESAECGSRTVSYLKKSDRKVCAMQMRGLPENTGHFNGRAAHSERPHNEPLYTLMQASELKSSEVGWLEKLQDGAPGAVAAACKVISTGTSSSGRHTAVWKDESNTGSQRCGDKARVSEKVEAGDKGGNEVQPNPLWFVVAVWQRVLSNMTFRTWIELQSTRQAVALNDIKTSFASRGENLRSKLSREISDLEEFLRVEVDEKSRAERKALRTLRRLSSSATAVANDLTRLRESIATEMDLMREREESPFDASRVA